MDSWFASLENFEFIRARGKHFIAALKDNRLMALTQDQRQAKRYTRVDELPLAAQGVLGGYLKGDDQEVLLVRQVFTHQDGSTATLYLVCSDWTCDDDAITATYKKRWAVQVLHQSLKSNASLAKSPTRTVRTQSNQVFMTLCAAFKLEGLSIQAQLNPFALCRMRLINASRIA